MAVTTKLVVIQAERNKLRGGIPDAVTFWSALRQFEVAGNSLQRTIPDAVSSWVQLWKFDVWRNRLSGRIPAAVTSWKPLEDLRLERNRLSGAIPDAVAAWSELQRFDLYGNALKGTVPAAISSWAQLGMFGTGQESKLSGSIPDAVACWPKLQQFEAGTSCRFQGLIPGGVASWAQLKMFSIPHNELSGRFPTAVASWKELQELQVECNRLSGSVSDILASWTDLRTVHIGQNHVSFLIPGAVAIWTSLRVFISMGLEGRPGSARWGASGTLPDAVAAWSQLQIFSTTSNRLSGPIPDAVASWERMHRLKLGNNRLSGSIPSGLGMWRQLSDIDLSYNAVSGTIPEAVANLALLDEFFMNFNKLQGAIPDMVAAWRALSILELRSNALSHVIPEGIALWRDARHLQLVLASNRLSGAIPDATLSSSKLTHLLLLKNLLSGTLPDGLLRTSLLTMLVTSSNRLSGPLPEVLYGMSELIVLVISSNQHSGAIPAAMGFIGASPQPLAIDLSHNDLLGPIPVSIARLVWDTIFIATNNKLSGSLTAAHELFALIASDNKLAGSLPPLCSALQVLGGNRLEGTLPKMMRRCLLDGIDVSGKAGHAPGLRGPLPMGLRRASELNPLRACHQDLRGGIPSLRATLSMLALHNNAFTDISHNYALREDGSSTIFVHNNLLSCNLPRCGTARAQMSLSALGNVVQEPQGRLPTWISPMERNKVFWASRREGQHLLLRILVGVGLVAVIAATKFGRTQLLIIIYLWQHARAASHQLLVFASSQVLCCIAQAALKQVPFVMLLLWPWDMYKCPATLTVASACFRANSMIHVSASLLWGYLCFCAPGVECLTMLEYRQKALKLQFQSSAKRGMLQLLAAVLTLALSFLSIISQAGRSVPGLFGSGDYGLLVVNVCIGSAQGLLGNFVLPTLSEKLTSSRHTSSAIATLFMTCLVPAAVVVILDARCLGNWVVLWAPCRRNAKQFRHVATCSRESVPRCPWLQLDDDIEFVWRLLGESDVCDPHRARGKTSISTCVEGTLLRLQEFWFGVFIMTGLFIPAGRLCTNKGYVDPSEVLGRLVILAMFGIHAAGRLPVMMLLLFLSTLCEILVAAFSVHNRELNKNPIVDVATSSVTLTRVTSSIAHVSSSFESDPAFVVVCAFVLSHFGRRVKRRSHWLASGARRTKQKG